MIVLACTALSGAGAHAAEPLFSTPLLEPVSVTATRIRSVEFEATTPTTTLDEEQLVLRAPDTLANALARLPQMRSPATEGTGSLNFGQSSGRGFANLRGLGTNRTLVLLDGARPVSNSLSGDRDMLTLPSALIRRVDVVTGGASASYGSDAVGGVVNFILDSRFTGLDVIAEAGTSSRSDASLGKVSAAWGRTFGDNWHLVASAEFFDRNGLKPGSRSFATPAAIIANPGVVAGNGQLPLLLVRNAYDATQAPGGLILNGPLAGQQFLADGTVAPYVPSSCSLNQPYVLCDRAQPLAATYGTITLSAPQRRAVGFGRLTVQLTPALEATVDAHVARVETQITSLPLESSAFGVQLQVDVEDNPFLPQAVRSQYLAAGIPTLEIGRQNLDQGEFVDDLRQDAANFGAGLRLQLSERWQMRARASYGRASTGERWVNAYSIDRFLNAIDVVSVNGRPTCRINAVTVTDAGCAPANIFGSGNLSAETRAYFLGDIRKPTKTSQRDLTLDLTGEAGQLPAGPLAIAAGASYRKEITRQFNDGLDRGFAFTGYPAFSGETEVGELYAQAMVPLARDLSWARRLEAELAARWVDYSQVGSETPWKLGLGWTPVEGLRLRASRSEDIRAPSVLELHLPQFESSITAQVNPLPAGLPQFNALGYAPGQTLNVREVGGGNPALSSEVARTTAVGVTVTPAQLPGFQASLDHYRIRIRDAITTTPAATIIRGCADGDASQCALIKPSSGSALPTVETISLNAQSFETSGLDLELRYRFAIGGGEATVRALSNYLLRFRQTVRGSTVQELRGDMTSGLPRFQGDLALQYRRGGTTAVLSGLYVGGGRYRNTLAADLQNNHVDGIWYVGANIEQQMGTWCSACSVFASVANLFDEAPPHPGYGIYSSIDSNIFSGVPYDRVGRYFKLGFRFSQR